MKTPPPGFRRDQSGFSLVEMLVVLAILSILAAVAVPYAQVTVTRDKELELKVDLREMRGAIDRFHGDWLNGQVSKLAEGASEDGYPKTLLVLIQGVQGTGPGGAARKYLRRIPENPFGDKDQPPEGQWAYRSYPDKPGSTDWGGEDVYDVYCPGDAKALDGSRYHDW